MMLTFKIDNYKIKFYILKCFYIDLYKSFGFYIYKILFIFNLYQSFLSSSIRNQQISQRLIRIQVKLNKFYKAQSMFCLIRTIGGGPKNRMKQDGFNLDLTYITDRILAMAYPAQGFQSLYRNSLEQVVEFLEKRHKNNYMIVNVSNRKYNYQKFGGKIKDYFWPNHQTPELKTLFQICLDVSQYLDENKENVVVFHCNHGKGRTGTAIISYLMYNGTYKDLKQSFSIYNKKRFSSSAYKIQDAPCQTRYLRYFEKILQNRNIDFDHLKPLRLNRIISKGVKKSDKIFFKLTFVKDSQQIGSNIKIKSKQTFINMKDLCIGDIKAQIYVDSIFGEKLIGWINFNTYFTQKYREYYKVKEITQEQPYSEYFKIHFPQQEIKMKWGESGREFTFIFDQATQQEVYNSSIHKQQVSNYTQEGPKNTAMTIEKKVKRQKQSFETILKILNQRKKYLKQND